MNAWGFEVKAVYNPAMNGLDLYFIRRLGDRREILQAPEIWNTVTLEPYAPAGDIKPTMFFDINTLHSLADALEKQGIRPDNNNRALGELDATKKHLEDMRRLVFKQTEEP